MLPLQVTSFVVSTAHLHLRWSTGSLSLLNGADQTDLALKYFSFILYWFRPGPLTSGYMSMKSNVELIHSPVETNRIIATLLQRLKKLICRFLYFFLPLLLPLSLSNRRRRQCRGIEEKLQQSPQVEEPCTHEQFYPMLNHPNHLKPRSVVFSEEEC